MKGMLAPKYKEVIQGKVEIRQVMKFSKALVAGSYVLEGKVCNNSKIRIIRDNIVLYEGQIESLRRFKDDVKEVIVATNSSLEGETTAMYISKLIKPVGIKVSRIASGVPVGGDLEYIDEVTLLRALEGRTEI